MRLRALLFYLVFFILVAFFHQTPDSENLICKTNFRNNPTIYTLIVFHLFLCFIYKNKCIVFQCCFWLFPFLGGFLTFIFCIIVFVCVLFVGYLYIFLLYIYFVAYININNFFAQHYYFT